MGFLCDYELSSGPSFEALAGAPLECYQLIVGGVSLAGVGADIHHLLPHRLVHVRVANHRVAATQPGLQVIPTARYRYLFSWFHETVGCPVILVCPEQQKAFN